MFSLNRSNIKFSKLFEDKVAYKVSELDRLKKVSKKNDQLISDHISVLAKLHNLSEGEIEHIFNEEVKLLGQKKAVQKHIKSKVSEFAKGASTFIRFMFLLLIVMFLIVSYRMGF